MKNVSKIILSIAIAVISFSCSESFLDIPPTGVYSESNLNNEAGVNKLLVAAYSKLNGNTEVAWNFGSLSTPPQGGIAANVHGGEAMKGSSKTDLPWANEFQMFGLTSGNDGTKNLFIYYFDAIDKCNLVLKIMANANEAGFTETEKTEIEAEARFLRAHYYFYAKRIFKNIPWIDETTADARQSNTVNNDGETFVNIWPQITEDMDFARKNLPPTQTEVARPNKWAADCYYAKILIYRENEGELASGYSDALTVLNDVMANGVTAKGEKYGLLPYYYYNFSAANENGPESVWAVQHTVNDNSTSSSSMVGLGPNGNQESRWMGTQIATAPGWGSGWGFYQASQWWVDHFRTKANGLPYLDMYDTNPHTLKNDMGIESSDPSFTPDTCGVDPRLDWSVGRRGIPFLDYGIMPGKAWIRNQQDGGPYLTKKWYVKNSQAGIYTTSKAAIANAINYCVIRYADVLLLAAECEARVGSLANARSLVNQVRNRMVLNPDNPNNRVKLDDGVTDAAKYRMGLYPSDGSADDAFTSIAKALDAILYERTLELGTEGHRFYDVVRFGKGEEEFNDFLSVTIPKFDFLTGAVYTDIPDSYSPIPTTAIDNSMINGVATLTQNPEY
jgi:starch-binding outer membrane protein, SusD/RagB family